LRSYIAPVDLDSSVRGGGLRDCLTSSELPQLGQKDEKRKEGVVKGLEERGELIDGFPCRKKSHEGLLPPSRGGSVGIMRDRVPPVRCLEEVDDSSELSEYDTLTKRNLRKGDK